MRRQASGGSGGYCSAQTASQQRRQSQRRQPCRQRQRLVSAHRQRARVAAGREEVGRLGRQRLTTAPRSTPRRDGSCWLRRPSQTTPPCLRQQPLILERGAGRAGSLPQGPRPGKSRPPILRRPLSQRERGGKPDARSRQLRTLALPRRLMTPAVAPTWGQPLTHRAKWPLQRPLLQLHHRRRHPQGPATRPSQAAQCTVAAPVKLRAPRR